MKTDDYVAEFVLWPRQDISWTPLCSHLSLGEAIRGGIEHTPEQLEVIVAVRRTRAKEVANKASISFRANRRAEDEDAYKAKVTSDKKTWSAKNLDKVNKTAAKVRQKNISSRRFHCADCDKSFQSQDALDKHLTRQAHADVLAGIKLAPMSASAQALKKKRQENRDKCLHKCVSCDKSFDTEWSLKRHFETPYHQKRAPPQTPS